MLLANRTLTTEHMLVWRHTGYFAVKPNLKAMGGLKQSTAVTERCPASLVNHQEECNAWEGHKAVATLTTLRKSRQRRSRQTPAPEGDVAYGM
jgi:hypothetical protein